MKIWIALVLVAWAARPSLQACKCDTMKWASCNNTTPCSACYLQLGSQQQPVDCTKLIPKCFLMKVEMARARRGQSTRGIGGKPAETALLNNDGIYDPDCESDGKFKARQCNNTETCWCVNSAGVRRTDKGDKTLKCDKLVETHMIRLELVHKSLNAPLNANNLKPAVADAIHKRYKNFNKALVDSVTYDPEQRLLVVDLKKEKGDRTNDLTHMPYYMEKDIQVLPLFEDGAKFEPVLGGQIQVLPLFEDGAKFEPVLGGQTVPLEKITVYYVDEEAPTITMQHLSGGIIAVIVVVVLAVVAGLLILFFTRKKQNQRYNKAQQREMEAM